MTVEELFSVVSDLETYPKWLEVVSAVEPSDADDGDPGPAWNVTLRGPVGRFARSKRLRMVRVSSDEAAPHSVRFERRELDGREHSEWIMTGACTAGAEPSTSRVDITLLYTGGLWSTILDSLLRDEISFALNRLPEFVASRQG